MKNAISRFLTRPTFPSVSYSGLMKTSRSHTEERRVFRGTDDETASPSRPFPSPRCINLRLCFGKRVRPRTGPRARTTRGGKKLRRQSGGFATGELEKYRSPGDTGLRRDDADGLSRGGAARAREAALKIRTILSRAAGRI